ncbi:MAG: hypothetical protein ACKVIF_10930 [Rhodospirillales bacterium]
MLAVGHAGRMGREGVVKVYGNYEQRTATLTTVNEEKRKLNVVKVSLRSLGITLLDCCAPKECIVIGEWCRIAKGSFWECGPFAHSAYRNSFFIVEFRRLE